MKRYHFQKDMFQFLTFCIFLNFPPKPPNIYITVLALTLILCNRWLSCIPASTVLGVSQLNLHCQCGWGKQISLLACLLLLLLLGIMRSIKYQQEKAFSMFCTDRNHTQCHISPRYTEQRENLVASHSAFTPGGLWTICATTWSCFYANIRKRPFLPSSTVSAVETEPETSTPPYAHWKPPTQPIWWLFPLCKCP